MSKSKDFYLVDDDDENSPALELEDSQSQEEMYNNDSGLANSDLYDYTVGPESPLPLIHRLKNVALEEAMETPDMFLVEKASKFYRPSRSVNESSDELLPRKTSVTNIKKEFKLTKSIKEKIVICLDLATEMSSRLFQMGDGSEVSSLNLAKKVIKIFIHNKIAINDKHEFALAILSDGAIFVSDFTSDPIDIIRELNDIIETMPCQAFEMSNLFEMIEERLTLPDNDELEPPYLIRAILIYGRSKIVPTLSGDNLQSKFQFSKYFFLDVLYIHDIPSNKNNCKEIHDLFIEFDVFSNNYIFEVSRNPTKLHNCMAMLMGHPLQRCPQSEANYKITL